MLHGDGTGAQPVRVRAGAPTVPDESARLGGMPSVSRVSARTAARPCPVPLARTESSTAVDPDIEHDATSADDAPWVTIVWNDPVNLMSYVTYVFQTLLGHPRAKAEQLMLDVHHKGRAAVANGSRDQMETVVTRLHSAGLWATMMQDR